MPAVILSSGLSVVIFIITFFLGERFEISLSQSLALMNADLTRIVDYPIALALFALSGLSLVWFLARRKIQ